MGTRQRKRSAGAEGPEDCLLRELWEEFGLRLAAGRLVWRRVFPSTVEAGRSSVFFGGWLSPDEVTAIRFGDEGQRWELMPVAGFLDHARAVPEMQRRAGIVWSDLLPGQGHRRLPARDSLASWGVPGFAEASPNRRQEPPMTEEIVKGRDVTIRFDGGRCVHSRNCVLGHPEVFVPNVQGEWIHPDAASAETVMFTALACPSGAIRAFRNDGSATSDTPPVVNTVRVRENGPLAVEAELQIRGEAQATPRATLCRCGQSQNKPFCDGAHAAAGFTATGEPAAKEFKALEVRNGPLTVEPQPNGPLMVMGNLEIVSGTGRTLHKVTKTWLCRCGHSANKPYCDGSHKAAGFVAD
jgi:CDGSH-type Zn-finger protein/uncharacterized Fe-S cluster protein YjdI/ADP-ribose pyrophosphatase YjhB (NUDIX family)